MSLVLEEEKSFGFNFVMLLLKPSAKGVSYEIPFPFEEEESANTATTQPLSVTCETKPLGLSQEDVLSVQNRLKKGERFHLIFGSPCSGEKKSYLKRSCVFRQAHCQEMKSGMCSL